ncbi:MAG: methyl-accepting chemotaxis protein [Oligoflexia bacterium]|nr:methyl-accepting chemotaxis protein [Oligoflexia bacterium]
MSSMSLRWRVIAFTIVACLIPAILITVACEYSMDKLGESMTRAYKVQAENLSDVIDRNLFERYGDVQAFGYNDAIKDKASWYQVGADKNSISAVMDKYVAAYVIYALTILVDLNGKVIAVNTKDAAGKSLDTAYLYSKNFADQDWFKQAREGKFYTKEGALTGTVVEDYYADTDVSKVFGSDGLTIGFSAPVVDADGKLVGIWKNFAGFSLVTDMIKAAHDALGAQGLSQAEIFLLRQDGTVIADQTGGAERAIHLGENLSSAGVASAKLVLAGGSGVETYQDASSGERYVSGYSHNKGALGFIGMPWSVIINVPERVALAEVASARMWALVIAFVSILLIGCGAYWFVGRLLRPVDGAMDKLRRVIFELRQASSEVADGGNQLSASSNEQAAAIQESVSAISEIRSMVAQTSEQARDSLNAAQQTREQIERGGQTMGRLAESMDRLTSLTDQLKEMVAVIEQISSKTAVINDIVFKTQLLSFNASIEAARAGQHGRGFAVVAEEVGGLAELSGTAAKEIQSLIADSRKQVEQVVEVTQNRIEEGRGVGRDSLAVFDKLTRDVQSISEKAERINSAAREQELGIQQMSAGMTQVDAATHKNNVMAVETANLAHKLLEECGALLEAMNTVQVVLYGAAHQQYSQNSNENIAVSAKASPTKYENRNTLH